MTYRKLLTIDSIELYTHTHEKEWNLGIQKKKEKSSLIWQLKEILDYKLTSE